MTDRRKKLEAKQRGAPKRRLCLLEQVGVVKWLTENRDRIHDERLDKQLVCALIFDDLGVPCTVSNLSKPGEAANIVWPRACNSRKTLLNYTNEDIGVIIDLLDALAGELEFDGGASELFSDLVRKRARLSKRVVNPVIECVVDKGE